jgi:nitrogen-specific signal transduction histidine kinase
MKLFRLFFTTKANGRGLGLAVQKIIVQHGGQVQAKRPEAALRFIITLPLPRRVLRRRIKEGQHLKSEASICGEVQVVTVES